MADSGNLAGVRVTQKKLDGNVLNNFSCGLGGSDIFRWVAGYFFSSLHYRDGGHREKKAALNSIVMISTKEGGGEVQPLCTTCFVHINCLQGKGWGGGQLDCHSTYCAERAKRNLKKETMKYRKRKNEVT